jgi:hypothetical protein
MGWLDSALGFVASAPLLAFGLVLLLMVLAIVAGSWWLQCHAETREEYMARIRGTQAPPAPPMRVPPQDTGAPILPGEARRVGGFNVQNVGAAPIYVGAGPIVMEQGERYVQWRVEPLPVRNVADQGACGGDCASCGRKQEA